jgi:hypothetical protein
VRGIATCADNGEFNASRFHCIEHKVIQCCANAAILMLRVNGEVFDLTRFFVQIECVSNKADDASINFANQCSCMV